MTLQSLADESCILEFLTLFHGILLLALSPSERPTMQVRLILLVFLAIFPLYHDRVLVLFLVLCFWKRFRRLALSEVNSHFPTRTNNKNDSPSLLTISSLRTLVCFDQKMLLVSSHR